MKKEINYRKVTTTIISNSLSIIKGVAALLLIPFFLTEVDQGFWYTFTSLATMASLADLGFMTIVGQFSAHEYSHLSLDRKEFTGPDLFIDRLSSLLKFIAKWVSFVSIVAFPIIALIGGIVLGTNGSFQVWILPWILYMLGSALAFIASSFLAFFEGCDQISNIQINRSISNLFLIGSMVLLLIFGFGLYALAIPTCIGALFNCLLLFVRFRKPIIQLIKRKVEVVINWKKPFFKLIWKYALSWVSGFLMFQIYTPLAYMRFNTEAAGKVGITITLIQSCMLLANSWNTIITPNMNMYASNNDWVAMDKLEKKAFLLSLVTAIVGYSILIAFFLLFRERFEIFDRFMGNIPIITLCFAFSCQLLMQSIALYGRAHKIEPFLIPSLASAVFILISTLILANTASIDYYFMGFAVSEFISVFVFLIMYFKNRNKWHDKLVIIQRNGQ